MKSRGLAACRRQAGDFTVRGRPVRAGTAGSADGWQETSRAWPGVPLHSAKGTYQVPAAASRMPARRIPEDSR